MSDGGVNETQGLLRIGEAAALTGLSARAVRMYEQCGLLGAPVRTPAGYRIYGGMAVAQLVRIRRLRGLGLGLAQIRQVLDPATPTSLDDALAMVRGDLAAQVRRSRADLRCRPRCPRRHRSDGGIDQRRGRFPRRHRVHRLRRRDEASESAPVLLRAPGPDPSQRGSVHAGLLLLHQHPREHSHEQRLIRRP